MDAITDFDITNENYSTICLNSDTPVDNFKCCTKNQDAIITCVFEINLLSRRCL